MYDFPKFFKMCTVLPCILNLNKCNFLINQLYNLRTKLAEVVSIVNCVFAMPLNNYFAERIFRVMGNKLRTNERNHLQTGMLRAKLLIVHFQRLLILSRIFNFFSVAYTCQDTQKKLLKTHKITKWDV